LKVDLNEEPYTSEVPRGEPWLSPAERGSPVDPLPTPESFLEDVERGKQEVFQVQENSQPAEASAQNTPPQKEENQPVAAKESIRNIG
jgi:hypothetical protein